MRISSQFLLPDKNFNKLSVVRYGYGFILNREIDKKRKKKKYSDFHVLDVVRSVHLICRYMWDAATHFESKRDLWNVFESRIHVHSIASARLREIVQKYIGSVKRQQRPPETLPVKSYGISQRPTAAHLGESHRSLSLRCRCRFNLWAKWCVDEIPCTFIWIETMWEKEWWACGIIILIWI